MQRLQNPFPVSTTTIFRALVVYRNDLMRMRSAVDVMYHRLPADDRKTLKEKYQQEIHDVHNHIRALATGNLPVPIGNQLFVAV